MIERLLSWVRWLPAALWSVTGGRLVGRGATPIVAVPVLAEREQPKSVGEIALRASLVVAAVGFAAYMLYQLRLLLILIFLAILLAAGLYAVVRGLERWLPRIAAVLVTYVALLTVVGAVMALIFPPLVQQAVAFGQDWPAISDDLRANAIQFIDGIAGPGRGEEIVGTLTEGASSGLPELGSLVSVPLTIAGIIANLVVVLFMSALMLIERDRARGYLLEFVDDADHEVAIAVAQKALLKLGAYVRGQLLVMAVIGVGSAAGMLLIGLIIRGSPLPFAVPLGALSFMTAAIPLAGAFIAGGPIVLVALTVSPLASLLMLAWLIGLQQLEGSVITPYIQGRVVNLSAIAVLLGVVAGTSIAGIVGGIIAIPLVAVADVVIREIVFPLRRRSAARRAERPASS